MNKKTSIDSVDVNKGNYVFISYSSVNQQMADSVCLLLKENNISCWMAPYDIPAGSRYAYVINDALENCSCVLLLLTNASQLSQFVEREIERAITYKKPILPMQLEDLKLNSGFKFYIGSSQIVAVPEIRADAPEFIRILAGIKELLGCSDTDFYGYAGTVCSDVRQNEDTIMTKENQEWKAQDKTDDIRSLLELIDVNKVPKSVQNPITEAKVGDIVEFGELPKRADAIDPDEAVKMKWIVIDVKESIALLLLKSAAKVGVYEGIDEWLKTEFMKRFTSLERNFIVSHNGNENSMDRYPFLLTVNEAREYSNQCVQIKTGVTKGLGKYAWWLCQDKRYPRNYPFVSKSGIIKESGLDGRQSNIAVRPAVYVKMK